MADLLLQTSGLVIGRSSDQWIAVSDFGVAPGDVWAILGPNGAGKSTLLDTLAGLIAPLGGGVKLGGADIASLKPAARGRLLASVAQREEIPEGFSLRDAVVMGRLPHAAGYWESPEDWARAEASLARMELADLKHRRAEETSGGEYQRTLIARALAAEAPLLILDEPTSSIDAEHLQRLGDVLREEAAQGRGVIVSTHNLEWAAVFADRFLTVDQGMAQPLPSLSDLEAWIKARLAPMAALQPLEQGFALSMGYRRT